MSFYHVEYRNVNIERRKAETDQKRERRLRRTLPVHTDEHTITVRMRNSDGRLCGMMNLPISEWAKTLIL